MPHYTPNSMQFLPKPTSFECSDFLPIFDQASNLLILTLMETIKTIRQHKQNSDSFAAPIPRLPARDWREERGAACKTVTNSALSTICSSDHCHVTSPNYKLQDLYITIQTTLMEAEGTGGSDQCDQKKSPNVYKSCLKMISLEKW